MKINSSFAFKCKRFFFFFFVFFRCVVVFCLKAIKTSVAIIHFLFFFSIFNFCCCAFIVKPSKIVISGCIRAICQTFKFYERIKISMKPLVSLSLSLLTTISQMKVSQDIFFYKKLNYFNGIFVEVSTKCSQEQKARQDEKYVYACVSKTVSSELEFQKSINHCKCPRMR